MTAQITVQGGLVRPIDLRFTAQGKPVASGTIASTERYKKGEDWVDGRSLYLPFTIWGEQAEHIASSNLEQGQQVTISGSLHTRKFEDKQGQQRSVTELDVKDFSVSLKRATVQVTKTGGQSAGRATAPAQQSPFQSQPAADGVGDVWGAPGETYPTETPF